MIEPAATRLVSVKNWPRRLLSAAGDRELVTPLEQHGRPEELVVDPGDLERRRARPAPGGPAAWSAASTAATRWRRPARPTRRSRAGSSSCSCSARTCRSPSWKATLTRISAQKLLSIEPESLMNSRQRDLAEHPEHRDQQRLRRQQVGGQEEAEQGQVEPEAEPGQHEGHHRGQEQGQQHGRDGDDQGVLEVQPELALLPGLLVVVEGPAAEGEVAVGLGVGVVAERVDQGPEQREQPDQRRAPP